MKTVKDYVWLRHIHRYWILPLEAAAVVLLVVALLAAALLPLLGARHSVAITFGVLLGGSLAAAMIQHSLFYHFIRCPICGHNPTRYKNGNNIPRTTAWNRLRDMESCPSCRGKTR